MSCLNHIRQCRLFVAYAVYPGCHISLQHTLEDRSIDKKMKREDMISPSLLMIPITIRFSGNLLCLAFGTAFGPLSKHLSSFCLPFACDLSFFFPSKKNQSILASWFLACSARASLGSSDSLFRHEMISSLQIRLVPDVLIKNSSDGAL